MFTCMYVFITPNNNNNNSNCQDTINYETFFVTVWVPVPITEKACSWGDLWFFFLIFSFFMGSYNSNSC